MQPFIAEAKKIFFVFVGVIQIPLPLPSQKQGVSSYK
jgi:hypothetical protein